MELQTIHSDARGSISLLLGDLNMFKEVTVFKTNAGFARGGCQHDIHDEFACVVEGEIEYVLGKSKEVFIMGAGDTLRIPRGTPHYFLSINSSVVLEWGADPEEKKNKHAEFRKIVDDFNSTKIASDML